MSAATHTHRAILVLALGSDKSNTKTSSPIPHISPSTKKNTKVHCWTIMRNGRIRVKFDNEFSIYLHARCCAFVVHFSCHFRNCWYLQEALINIQMKMNAQHVRCAIFGCYHYIFQNRLTESRFLVFFVCCCTRSVAICIPFALGQFRAHFPSVCCDECLCVCLCAIVGVRCCCHLVFYNLIAVCNIQHCRWCDGMISTVFEVHSHCIRAYHCLCPFSFSLCV